MAKRENVDDDRSDSCSSSSSYKSCASLVNDSKETLKIDSRSEDCSRELRGCSVRLITLSETLTEQACRGGAKSVQRLIADMEDDVFNGVQCAIPLNQRSSAATSSSSKSSSTSSSSSSSDSDDSSKGKKKPQRKVKKDSSGSEMETRASRLKARKSRMNGNRNAKRKRNVIVQSDDSEKTDISSDESSSSKESDREEISKTKTRRKRVKFNDSSDDSDEEEDEKVGKRGKKRGRKPKVDNSSPNKGRKNIRKLLTESDLKEETKKANDEEKARVERIAEKQKLYNELIKNEFASKQQKMKRCILEIDEKTKEVIVEIDPILCEYLKPHQFEGIKFMWNCLVESVARLESSPGSGCILAHSMGLGKTLQVVSFVHTLLTNEHTGKHVKTVAIVCPVNTVRNWTNEFHIWLGDNNLLDFMIFEASDCKTVIDRVRLLKLWKRKGGVLIIGIPMFSSLICGGRGKKVQKKAQEVFNETLVDPGADVVICDEGHLMKNEKTAFNKAVNEVRTLRRAILTGTPLQNNLNEYQVMAQFVKPNLLGTKKEFTNRFVNPITNGQCADSTDGDVMLMKKRVHVLHKLLDGCVQRFDYGVLAPYLQPKCEYVIRVQLSETQIKLYRHYLENFCTRTRFSLLADYSVFRLIWNHPFLLYRSHQSKQERLMMKEDDEEDSLKDFICDESDASTPESNSSCSGNDSSDEDSGSENEKKKSKKNTRSKGKTDDLSQEVSKKWMTRSRGGPAAGAGESTSKSDSPEVITSDGAKPTSEFPIDAWFSPFISADDFSNYHLSGKMIILFSILEECERIGDKVLIFSQSLPLLDLVEDCLATKMREGRIVPHNDSNVDDDVTNSWIRGIDYFRIDGSVESTSRKKCIDKFNDPSNLRSRLFLLSTKAGSLGINLIGANRCVIFDASWNPTHDIQAIFRIYRFGQTKPVYIYRFLAQGTMEEKIYDRQVMKQSLSCRVIDEQQVERHFKASDIAELYAFNPDTSEERPTPKLPKDRLLADILLKHKDFIVSYHEHDSLLESKPEEDLTEEERKAAWVEFEEEKDEELQRKKREEAMLKQRAAQQQSYLQSLLSQNMSKSTVFNAGKTSVTIGSTQYPNFAAANATIYFSGGLLSPHGLPSYEKITLEDIAAYFGETNLKAAIPKLYQVLTTGLNYVATESKNLRDIENIRVLDARETNRKMLAEVAINNLQNQIARLRTLHNTPQVVITPKTSEATVTMAGGVPKVTISDMPTVTKSSKQTGRITISADELD